MGFVESVMMTGRWSLDVTSSVVMWWCSCALWFAKTMSGVVAVLCAIYVGVCGPRCVSLPCCMSEARPLPIVFVWL